ncbi:MAG TPA: BsuPI-related putative proteinase inhibitor [Gemmatimonadaceae bacterium]
MNTRLAIPILCAAAIGIACSSRSHSKDVAAPAQAQSVQGHPKIKTFLAVEHRNHGVRLALHVVNTSNKNIEIDFPNGQAYDFVVVDSLGRQVWQWARARMFTQSTQIKYVSGGHELEVAENWKNPPAPGNYTAIATLISTNLPVSERVAFTVR